MKTKIGLVIQARMGSTRLPGKVLMPLWGIPVLLRIIDQLKLLPISYQRIIITSTLKRDDIIETFCKSYNIHYFRGSEDDVLDRYYQTAKHYNLDHIVRITADNPFIDPAYTHRLIKDHIKTGMDYSTNKSEINSGLPVGIGCEIFTKNALERSWLFGLLAHHREHVNEYILENKNRFKVLEQQPLFFPKECSSLRLTLDTKEDFVFLEWIARKLEERRMDISVKNICKLHQEGLL